VPVGRPCQWRTYRGRVSRQADDCTGTRDTAKRECEKQWVNGRVNVSRLYATARNVSRKKPADERLTTAYLMTSAYLAESAWLGRERVVLCLCQILVYLKERYRIMVMRRAVERGMLQICGDRAAWFSTPLFRICEKTSATPISHLLICASPPRLFLPSSAD